MIERRVMAASPVAVEYSLTPIGRSLREPFDALYAWSLANADGVVGARERHDRIGVEKNAVT